MIIDDFINNKQSLCSALKFQSIDGKSKGNEYLLLNNGVIELLVDVTHGFDIAWFRYKGELLSLILNNGFNSSNEDFHYRFEGGFLYTCGLDGIGQKENLPLHGHYHLTPARIINIQEGEHLIVKAEIEFTQFFGQNILIERTITTSYNSSSIKIEDEIQNQLNKDVPYCMLYHFNFGYPFIDETCEIRIDSLNVSARNDFSKRDIKVWNSYKDGIKNEEQVYFHSQNTNHIEIINHKSNKKIILDYTGKDLTKLIEWKCQVYKNYALGIEPSTSFLDNLYQDAYLKPKEKITNSFIFKISE